MIKPDLPQRPKPRTISYHAMAVLSVAVAIVAAEFITSHCMLKPSHRRCCALLFSRHVGGFGPALMAIALANGCEAMQAVTDRSREPVIRSRQDEAQQVLLSVRDCGVGSSVEDADRLFEACFTTKSSGMGMGLSICRSSWKPTGGVYRSPATRGPGRCFNSCCPFIKRMRYDRAPQIIL